MPWSRPFDLPIPGLSTLRDAATYVTKLPKSEQSKPHWQFAVEMLLRASGNDAWIIFARMAMLKAMNFGKPERVKEPRRKAVKAYRVIPADTSTIQKRPRRG